jgi:RNA binding exosome subunit
MKGPIQSVEVTFLVQATEDSKRVETAVRGLLGDVEITREELEGHFGNRIVRGRAHVTGQAATAAFESIASRLSPEAREELLKNTAKYMDEHSALYIRLDKQLLVNGRVELSQSDSVRIKVKPRLHGLRGGALQVYRRMISLG